LPFDPGAVHVEMVWHLRRDDDPAHRWLREVLHSAVQAPA
jgi:DNA-binding transcriptional LysR family regulator